MNRFGELHPLVLMVYFVEVLVFSIFTVHPVIRVFSCASGMLFYGLLKGIRGLMRELTFYIPLFLLLTITNPLFSHDGETILFFMNDNPITLEAFLYGGNMALLIVGILFWCKVYSLIMTSDKFIYLFGKSIPQLSLVLSMVLRFIPLYKQQLEKIRQTQKAMGFYSSDSYADKVKSSLRVLDSILGWAIENSIDTADGMKARGYGLSGRSNYSIFTFYREDGMVLGILLLLGGFLIAGNIGHLLEFQFYPTVSKIHWNNSSISVYGCSLLLFCLPMMISCREKLRWKYLLLKI